MSSETAAGNCKIEVGLSIRAVGLGTVAQALGKFSLPRITARSPPVDNGAEHFRNGSNATSHQVTAQLAMSALFCYLAENILFAVFNNLCADLVAVYTWYINTS